MPGQSVNTNAGTLEAGRGSGSNKPTCRASNSCIRPLSIRFTLYTNFLGAVTGREVPPDDFDRDDCAPHMQRHVVNGLQTLLVVEQFGDVEIGRGVDVANLA